MRIEPPHRLMHPVIKIQEDPDVVQNGELLFVMTMWGGVVETEMSIRPRAIFYLPACSAQTEFLQGQREVMLVTTLIDALMPQTLVDLRNLDHPLVKTLVLHNNPDHLGGNLRDLRDCIDITCTEIDHCLIYCLVLK